MKLLATFILFFLSYSAFSQYTFQSSSVGAYQTISNTGTPVGGFVDSEGDSDNDDGQSNDLNLPFPFEFNGVNYNSFKVSTNGYITFVGDATSVYDFLDIPVDDGDGGTNPPIAGIAILGRDLEQETGTIYYETVGAGTDDERFIIEWYNWAEYNNNGRFSMQMSLYKNGKITFLYDHPSISLTNNQFAIGLIFGNSDYFGVNSLSYDASSSESNYGNTITITISPSVIPTTEGQYLLYEFSPTNDDSDAPSLSVIAPLATLTSCSGASSTNPITFGIDGTSLTESVTITAPSGFEISTDPGGTYSSSLTLTNTSTITETLYIRLSYSETVGTISGSITATSSSTTATTTVSGTVNAIPSILINESDASGSSDNDSKVCIGGVATLSAIGGDTYTWSTIEDNNTSQINPSISSITTYTVTGTTSGCSNTASITINVESLPALAFNSIALCNESTFLITNTTSVSNNESWTVTGANTVNNGYITAGTTPGDYEVGYTDGCAQTVSATVYVAPTSNLPAITDGQASYKFDGTPKGPSSASYYMGYNGFNYSSTTRPTKPGFYKANNQSEAEAGCPYTFYIIRCTTCSDVPAPPPPGPTTPAPRP